MKRLFYLCAFVAFAFVACNGNKSGNNKGFFASNSGADTVRLDAVKNRDMLIILSILPDSITKTLDWTRADRYKLRQQLDSQSYYIDSAHIFSNLKKFENNQIAFDTDSGDFTMTAYQISDGHYLILCKDDIDGKQYLTSHEVYKNTSAVMDLDLSVGKYKYIFLKDASSATCLGMFYEKNPEFDYDITDPSILKIKLKNYSQTDSKDCLKGNELTLKFNQRNYPFDIIGIKWLE
ncbi:hypothetical protein ACXZ1K_13170 [Pedobacter sp. PWIIR3]